MLVNVNTNNIVPSLSAPLFLPLIGKQIIREIVIGFLGGSDQHTITGITTVWQVRPIINLFWDVWKEQEHQHVFSTKGSNWEIGESTTKLGHLD
jgi:hypothetical protein